MADVTQRDVPVYLEIVEGQTKGSQDVEIRARVEGYLNSAKFTEGAFVPKGTPLYEIDPLPLQAALANAKADLATADARLGRTNNDVARYRPLAEQQADLPAGAGQRSSSAQEAARGHGGRAHRRRWRRRRSISATPTSRRRSTGSWERPR